jgi:hypothetical protein
VDISQSLLSLPWGLIKKATMVAEITHGLCDTDFHSPRLKQVSHCYLPNVPMAKANIKTLMCHHALGVEIRPLPYGRLITPKCIHHERRMLVLTGSAMCFAYGFVFP